MDMSRKIDYNFHILCIILMFFMFYSPTHSIASTSFEEPSNISIDNSKFVSSVPLPPVPVPLIDNIESQIEQHTIIQPLVIPSNPASPPPPAPPNPPAQRAPSPQPQQTLHQQQQQAHMAILTEAKEKLKQEKKEKHATKKLIKELSVCKTILGEMEVRFDRNK